MDNTMTEKLPLTHDVNAKVDEVADSAQRAVDELSRKANQMTDKASTTINTVTDEIKNQTTRKVDNAVKGINNVALYVKDWQEKDTEARLETVSQTVRRHPMACLLSGVALGWLVGRMMK